MELFNDPCLTFDDIASDMIFSDANIYEITVHGGCASGEPYPGISSRIEVENADSN
jgi:hypothetical protein